MSDPMMGVPTAVGRRCGFCKKVISKRDGGLLTHDGPLCKPCGAKGGYTWDGMKSELRQLAKG